MTDEERLAIVERVKQNSAAAHARKIEAGAVAGATNRDGRSLRAARHALEHRTSLSVAARLFHVQVGTVSETFRRLFPDVPALASQRAGMQRQAWPEDEVSW